MKVIYFFRPSGDTSGVQQKIHYQVEQLLEYGIHVELYPITGKSSCPEPVSKSNIFIESLRFSVLTGIIRKLKREADITTSFGILLESLSGTDIIYSRIPYPTFSVARLLRRPRAGKIVIEYQTIEPLEYRLKGKYWYLILDVLFGDAIRKYTDGIVGVTDEITQYEVGRSGNPHKPHITIANGITVNNCPLRQRIIFNGSDLHLLFVANVSRWHGLDRLIEGLAAYHGPLQIVLHIAGEGAELPNLKRMATDRNLSEQVIFHGFTTGTALDDLFNTCHIAVGSLGIHRIGLTESSTLKVREYCARGIPYIIACKDPDFPDDYPYIYRISPDESPVNIEDVIEFAKRVSADPDHPHKMRAYAAEHLDWSVKMKKLKTFLESLVDDSPS